jgi:hypothetical protein
VEPIAAAGPWNCRVRSTASRALNPIRNGPGIPLPGAVSLTLTAGDWDSYHAVQTKVAAN